MKDLVGSNPMMIEFVRGARRFFSVGKHGKVGVGTIAAAAALYLLLILLTAMVREYTRPIAVALIGLFLVSVMVPAAGHGTIVGERERRSWDFILISPMSDAQIVVGKLLSVVLTALVTIVLLLPLMLMVFHAEGNMGESVGKLIGQFFIIVGWACLLGAATVFVSARSRRSLAANMAIYGAQFAWLLVIPSLVQPLYVSVLKDISSPLRSFFEFFNPYASVSLVHGREVVLEGAEGIPALGGGAIPLGILVQHYGLLQFIVYVALAAAVTLGTVRTLRTVDRKESLT